VGGAKHPDLVARDDRDLRRQVHGELASILPIRGEPLDALTVRYERAMPQIEVGFSTKKKRMEAACDALPGLLLAGSAKGAVGIPDCIASAERAAARAFAYLEQSKGSTNRILDYIRQKFNEI